jgi:pimeloyl-ACP methyl ester carboxylesterase
MKMQWETTGEGATLVLAPGGLTGWLSWIPHVERLSATRKVVRVQLLSVQLGLEGQPLPPGYSPKTESTALANTLESLGLTPPVDFAGWSYGAEITLDFALDNPGWVRTLTIIEPPAYWVLPSLDPEAKRALDEEQRLSRNDVTEDHLEAFLQRTALVPPGRNPRDLPQWPLWVRHRQSLRANPSIAEYQGDSRRLPAFAPPALLVKGTGSAPILHRIIDELARQLPNAQVTEWPGGHAPHIVSMEPFLERLAAFQASAG